MSKRKKPISPKKASSAKTVAQLHQIKHSVVKSAKGAPLRRVAEALSESPAQPEDDHSKQEARTAESQPATSQHDLPMKRTDSKQGFDLPSPTAHVQGYQSKLLELAQANAQLSFEFAQRLATISSAFEILTIITEFTSKRLDIFWKYSMEMAELSTKRC